MTQNDLDGIIERKDDGSTVITVTDEPWGLDFAGVTCINPDALQKDRLYQKTFHKKRIYTPEGYEKAVREIMPGDNFFAFSLNGYSKITPEQCNRYGIRSGDYEEACRAITRSIITTLRKRFKGVQIVLPYGASVTGVDGALEDVGKEYGVPMLGFSCPRFMLYVKDDDIPVYVGYNKEDYANRYIQTLDLLLATGGREQALAHDVLAACVYNKRIHFIDVLNSLSSTGGVPATIVEPDGRIRVDNAAAAMGRNVSFYTREMAVGSSPKDGDLWDSIVSNVNGVATGVCRQKMPAQYKFAGLQ